MKKPEHDHNSDKACPACGLAPRQTQPLTPWGFEFLAENLAPCTCGGAPVQITGGVPQTTKIYCQNKCGMESAEHPTLKEAVLDWNLQQIKKGFDARKLHPMNRDPKA